MEEQQATMVFWPFILHMVQQHSNTHTHKTLCDQPRQVCPLASALSWPHAAVHILDSLFGNRRVHRTPLAHRSQTTSGSDPNEATGRANRMGEQCTDAQHSCARMRQCSSNLAWVRRAADALVFFVTFMYMYIEQRMCEDSVHTHWSQTCTHRNGK